MAFISGAASFLLIAASQYLLGSAFPYARGQVLIMSLVLVLLGGAEGKSERKMCRLCRLNEKPKIQKDWREETSLPRSQSRGASSDGLIFPAHAAANTKCVRLVGNKQNSNGLGLPRLVGRSKI